MLGHTCHQPLYSNPHSQFQEVFPSTNKLISSPSLSMHGIPHSSYFTPNSQTHTSVTSQRTVPYTNPPPVPNLQSYYNPPVHSECIDLMIKRNFSDSWRKCFTIW